MRPQDAVYLNPGGGDDQSSASAATPRQLSLDWAAAERKLSGGECDRVIRTALAYPKSEAQVVGAEKLPGHRQGYVHKVLNDAASRWIYELLTEVADLENGLRYGLALSGIRRPPEYVEYVAGFGCFDWHNDYSHEAEDAPRKLTVILQLTESNDYEGGDLQVFGTRIVTLPRERGTILVLPSFLPHRVTAVTRGTRRILVAWIGGPRLQ